MRLKRFSVTKFRSIMKAEKLALGDLTVLVGPNNEGKSNLLEALAVGMQELSRPSRPGRVVGRRLRTRPDYDSASELTYSWPRDYPQSLQDAEPDGRTTMNFDFELTPEEVEEFFAEVGSRFNETLPVSISFGRSSVSSFQVRKQGRAAKVLAGKRSAIAEFIATRVQVQYVPAVRTGARVSTIVRRMLQRELARAAEDPKYAEALERLRQVQEPVFAQLSSAISERLQSLLPDVRAVSLVQEEDRMTRGVSVIVDDGTPTDLTLKGDGVQSLAALAMMQHYSRETAKAREFILAVEEPEAHLHPRAIHALRETLRETSESQQVVITTHSPLFVNRLDLASNVIVRRTRATPAASVQELRDALGVHTSDNLESAEVVLLVEGTSDEIALRALLVNRAPAIGRALENGVLAVLSLYGAGKMNYLLVQLRDSLAAPHAFLDDDDAGRAAASAARDAGLLTAADLTLAMCPGARSGSELEDLIEPAVYREAFRTEFGVNIDHPWINKLSKGKWSNRMRFIFAASGTEWSDVVEDRAKTLVAEAVGSDPANSIKSASSGVLEALTDALTRKLEVRLK